MNEKHAEALGYAFARLDCGDALPEGKYPNDFADAWAERKRLFEACEITHMPCLETAWNEWRATDKITDGMPGSARRAPKAQMVDGHPMVSVDLKDGRTLDIFPDSGNVQVYAQNKAHGYELSLPQWYNLYIPGAARLDTVTPKVKML
jgi:hypothetical protein